MRQTANIDFVLSAVLSLLFTGTERDTELIPTEVYRKPKQKLSTQTDLIEP